MLIVLTASSLIAGELAAEGPGVEILNGIKKLALTYPVITGIAAFGICIAVFFAAWRVFFPMSWHTVISGSNNPDEPIVNPRAKIDPPAAGYLIKELKESEKSNNIKPDVPTEVAKKNIGAIGSDENDYRNIEAIMHGLGTTNPNLRKAAVIALTEMSPMIIPKLIEVFGGENQHIR